MAQEIIAYLVVTIVVGYTFFNIFKSFKKDKKQKTPCTSCGCSLEEKSQHIVVVK